MVPMFCKHKPDYIHMYVVNLVNMFYCVFMSKWTIMLHKYIKFSQ